jgi:hypothetical protein
MRFDKSTNGREGGLGAAGGDMREDEMEEEVVGSLPVRWKARSFCRKGFGDSEASGSLRIRQSPVSSCEKIEDSSEMDADRYADSLCTSLSIDEREGGGWEEGSESPKRIFFHHHRARSSARGSRVRRRHLLGAYRGAAP